MNAEKIPEKSSHSDVVPVSPKEITSAADVMENVSCKHQVTPLKPKSKTSKSENKEDVHACPSPITPRSRLSRSQISSPSGSSLASAYYVGVCSQELPEVIWDYTSPKQIKGLKRNEKKIAIDDLLRNMHYENQVSNSDSNSSANLQLLEKWMEVRSMSPASRRMERKDFRKGNERKPPRHLVNEMQTILNSIDIEGCNSSNSGNLSDKTFENVNNFTDLLEQELQINSLVVDNVKNSLVSIDENWSNEPEEDDFIIVKATQEFESCLISSEKNIRKKPEESFKSANPHAFECDEQFSKTGCINEHVLQNSECKNIFIKPSLSSITEKILTDDNVIEKKKFTEHTDPFICALDSEFDNIWGDDLLELESLSQIPDDVLSGKACNSFELDAGIDCSKMNLDRISSNNPEVTNHQMKQLACNKNDMLCGCATACSVDSSDISSRLRFTSRELFQEPDCDPFSDDLTLNEHDFATWLNKMESQASLKCTPQEIAQKKEDALKRLKQKQKKSY